MYTTVLLLATLTPGQAPGGYIAPGPCPSGYCYYPPVQQQFTPQYSQYGVPQTYGGNCYGNSGFQAPQYSYQPQFNYQPPIFNQYTFPPPIILEERSFPRFRERQFEFDLRFSHNRQFAFR